MSVLPLFLRLTDGHMLQDHVPSAATLALQAGPDHYRPHWDDANERVKLLVQSAKIFQKYESHRKLLERYGGSLGKY